VLDFLFLFNKGMNADFDPRIGEWLSFVLILPIGFGISFQLPLVMLFINRIGLVSVETYVNQWRIAILTIFGWMGMTRLIRGQVLSLREREFVDAARMSGATAWRIVRHELLPNLWSPILVTFSLTLPALITTEAALSFLGVGIVEPIPDWGRMINRGAQVYTDDLSYMFFPGMALFVLVLCFNLLGDSVRDALDPKGTR